MIKDILLAIFVVYGISISILFWQLKSLFDEYKKVADDQINDLVEGQNKPPKTLYDWSKIPQEVKWIATSEGGFGFGYAYKPTRGYGHSGFWYGAGDSLCIIWPRENPQRDNWENSLEQRPEEFQ